MSGDCEKKVISRRIYHKFLVFRSSEKNNLINTGVENINMFFEHPVRAKLSGELRRFFFFFLLLSSICLDGLSGYFQRCCQCHRHSGIVLGRGLQQEPTTASTGQSGKVIEFFPLFQVRPIFCQLSIPSSSTLVLLTCSQCTFLVSFPLDLFVSYGCY